MQKPNAQKSKPYQHQPVLLEAVLRLLNPQANERYLDLTAGYGGHAKSIISSTGPKAQHVLVDRDVDAIKYLQNQFVGNVKIMHSDFEAALQKLQGELFDIVLMDLGVSSPQLDNADRGFSFRNDAPLDMRMDQTRGIRASEVVNTFSQRDLADIIYSYGEERSSRQIAKAIVDSRPITTTHQLAEVVSKAANKRHNKQGRSIHPATKTFQALRIVINDELGQVERSLSMIENVLAPDGRLAVISFHSLEDRIVKQFIRQSSLEILNKRPIQGKTEDVSNPRARSAKLRAAIKIKT